MKTILFGLFIFLIFFGIYKYVGSNDNEAEDISSEEIELDGDDYIDENGNYVMVLNEYIDDSQSCASDTAQSDGMEKLLRIKAEKQNKHNAVKEDYLSNKSSVDDGRDALNDILQEIKKDLPLKYEAGTLINMEYRMNPNVIIFLISYSSNDFSCMFMTPKEYFDSPLFTRLYILSMQNTYSGLGLEEAMKNANPYIYFIFRDREKEADDFDTEQFQYNG